jgi:hypothetical protein
MAGQQVLGVNACTMLVVGLLFAAAGCGGAPPDAPKLPLYPVLGTVSLDGKPISGAQVVLHAVDSSKLGDFTPTGVTDENGTFEISSYQPRDGAPEGSWSVTVSWPEILPGGGSDPEYGRERLPLKYQDPDKSGLVLSSSEDLRDPVVLELKSK